MPLDDDGRQRARRERLVGEKEIAVAALEARLVLDGHAVAEEAPARLAGEHVAQAPAQRARMRAAAHALAVRREDQRLDAREVRLVHDVGEAVLQPLVRKAGRDLADEAAGVRVAGLHAEPAAAARRSRGRPPRRAGAR